MNKRFAVVMGMAVVLMVASACVADHEGIKVGDPKAFAEATHIARLSGEAAAATATAVAIDVTRQAENIRAEGTRVAIDVTRQAENIRAEGTRQVQTVRATGTAQAIVAFAAQQRAEQVKAETDVERARAQSEQNAIPAASAGRAIGYLGMGVGALVLLVGLAFGVVAWVNKRATAVYPDKRGQFPVIVRQGIGWVAFHDPNRALGSATVARVPTALDGLAGVVVSTVKALKSGDVPRLPVPEPQAAFPLAGSEAALLQVASQEQAAQVRIAENPELPKVMLTAAGVLERGQVRGGDANAPRGRMPSVTVVNDPAQIANFEHRLLTGGE